MLRFVHFSDIHFNRRTAEFGFDPDIELRERLLDDVREMRGQLGEAVAILVSGDIAYAGKNDEYVTAGEWLDRACEAAGCSPEAVWLVPGNHDVDQDTIKSNLFIQDGHDRIRREQTPYDRNKELDRRLVQEEARKTFFAPLREYNNFAARYGSSFSADKESYVWQQDMPLDDNSILRIRGLNTALLSGLADRERSLFLGDRAITFERRTGVCYLTLAHHPPTWLLDGKEVDKALDDDARVQLFGHEHDSRIVSLLESVKIFAGSVSPHRAGGTWEPGYNIIEVSVPEGEERRLRVDVHARVWQRTPTRFRAIEDRYGKSYFRNEFTLPPLPEDWKSPWEEARREAKAAPDGNADTDCGADKEDMMVIDEVERATPDFRAIVYRFFRLNLSQKVEIVGRLKLAHDEDLSLSDIERFKLQLVRAREGDRLSALWELIKEKEQEQ